jgi:hypothetical protein
VQHLTGLAGGGVDTTAHGDAHRAGITDDDIERMCAEAQRLAVTQESGEQRAPARSGH